jgi:diaminopropionate ammonia-lyase
MVTASLFNTSFGLLRNPSGAVDFSPPGGFLTVEQIEKASDAIHCWPGYAPTPLISLPGLGTSLAIGGLWYKDEGRRFGVGSFKPMGGGHAVMGVVAREVERRNGGPVSVAALVAGEFASVAGQVTVACATDGNHGRAVAWAAKLFGCNAVAYLASHVSPHRESAIAAYGARTVRSKGNHEDAMRMMVADAQRDGWHVISETESASDPQIAYDTLAGYANIVGEIATDVGADTPTHIFVQAGVGGLAAATTAFGAHRWGAQRPRTVVVEAENSECVFRSLEVGERVTITGDMETVMAGLAAGEVSGYAWQVLHRGAHAAMVIPDVAALGAMRLLAHGPFGDHAIVGGESGVASLAAAVVACQDCAARDLLEIDETSRIVVYGTEGATDPELYTRLVGRAPEAVVGG